jgi:hypothetical protein
MSSDQVVLFGKYSGLTFEQVLEKDINYCTFIDNCPANKKTEDFKEYLKINLQAFLIKKNQQDLLKRLEKLKN